MSLQVIDVEGRQVQVHSSSSVPAHLVSSMLPSVIAVAARALIRSGVAVHQAVVEAKGKRDLQVTYRDIHHQMLRQEVIPVLAITQAVQDGRDALRRSGFDDDLMDMANEELNRRMRRRLDGV